MTELARHDRLDEMPSPVDEHLEKASAALAGDVVDPVQFLSGDSASDLAPQVAHAHAVLAQVHATRLVAEEIRRLRLALTSHDPDEVEQAAPWGSGAIDEIAGCIERYVGGAW
jgi:hypothetical protein